MTKWPTALLLILALAASTAVGVHADAHEGSCPMANMPDCCKKAHSAGDTQEVSMARLCCNLNCSEPASGGSNGFSTSFPSLQKIPSTSAVLPSAIVIDPQISAYHRQSSNASSSNPKYIQHLALLI